MLSITKFELARLIGVRATQISEGSTPLVNVEELFDPVEIARKEYMEGVIPLDIIREMPSGDKFKVVIKSCKVAGKGK